MNPINSHGPRICVVDNFNRKEIDIDGDNKPCVSHGHAVIAVIKGILPNAQIQKMESGQGLDEPTPGVIEQLREIQELLDQGETIDAINLSSSGAYVTVEKLQKDLGLSKLTKDNIPENREQILANLKDFYNRRNALEASLALETDSNKKLDLQYHIHYGYAYELNMLMRSIANRTTVFIAAGNNGRFEKADGQTYVNLWALVDGVHCVGALDKTGKVADYSANSSQVTDWAKGIFFPKKVFSQDGKIQGFDIVENGEVSVLPSDVSGGEQVIDNPSFDGTSYATPLFLAQFLANKNK